MLIFLCGTVSGAVFGGDMVAAVVAVMVVWFMLQCYFMSIVQEIQEEMNNKTREEQEK